MKTRQDAWSHEEDVLLAETVLQYIREGKTQLAAFEVVGRQLHRTAAACGFRWNAEVRKRYLEAIEQAKKQRKERKRALEMMKKWQKEAAAMALPAPDESKADEGSSPFLPAAPLTLDQCIAFLQTLGRDAEQLEAVRKENERLKRERIEWETRNEQLQQKLERLEARQTTVQEDFEALVKIMARARQLAAEESDRLSLAQLLLAEAGGSNEPIARS
ncbi:RsfA family transcriptional regulator [Geobacillus sp. BMUD]|uniref:RsfA family transcriptional regulator n=1 Tax=Geobacillus sp. BMUD TaxID=2508876 RepID=UPI0014930D50|nr:RsfA family transcriptional regulator [Geobacillus sp. BMUD]NNU83099.1 RsfA family transcriptional regulator [Geobacillus sp. BMUD]